MVLSGFTRGRGWGFTLCHEGERGCDSAVPSGTLVLGGYMSGTYRCLRPACLPREASRDRVTRQYSGGVSPRGKGSFRGLLHALGRADAPCSTLKRWGSSAGNIGYVLSVSVGVGWVVYTTLGALPRAGGGGVHEFREGHPHPAVLSGPATRAWGCCPSDGTTSSTDEVIRIRLGGARPTTREGRCAVPSGKAPRRHRVGRTPHRHRGRASTGAS